MGLKILFNVDSPTLNNMPIKVKLGGFDEGIQAFQMASGRFESIVSKELKIWGDEAVAHLKASVYLGELDLAPKMRDNGKPVLIDTETYINSYVAEIVDNLSMAINAIGENRLMTNQTLGELLEYGWVGEGSWIVPARPHIRPLTLWMLNRVNILGERILRGLLGHS